MRGANPLVQAPHVPKRGPDWGQFLEGAAASQSVRPAQGGRQAARTSAWGQVTSNPYHNSSTGQQVVQSTGPLKPAWLPTQTPPQQNTAAQHTQRQQQQPQPHNPSPLQHATCEPQDALQQHTAFHAAPQAPQQQQKATAAKHRPARNTKPALASAQRGLGALRGTVDTYLCDDSLAALHDLLGESLGQPEQSWQQQAAGTSHSVPTHPPAGQGQTAQQPQHDRHRQQQQHQQQQPQKQQQRQQQGICVKPVAAIAAWGLDDTDDVQLPDSWFDNSQAPAPGSVQAAAAPGSVQAATAPVSVSTHMDWGTGTGKQQTTAGRGVRVGQHASAVLQQRQKQPVHQSQSQDAQAWAQQQQQQQQQLQMQQRHAQGSDPDCLQQQAPWHQVHGQHTPSATAQQVPAKQSACQPGTQTLQLQQQQQRQQQPQQRRQLPWQQQQQQVSPQVPQAQVRQRHTAAGSVWSTGVNLAALNRVPAAAAAAPGIARDKPPAAAEAAAAAAGYRQPAQKPQNGSKAAVAKGSKKGKSSSSSSAITLEFVPKAAAEASLLQPELHQMDLFETLKRARRNKQREQQQQGSHEQQDDMQDDMYQQQQQGSMGVGRDGGFAQPGDGKLQAGSTAAKQQVNGRKRKRASATAAEAAPGAGSGCAAGASGGRRRGAASGGGGSGGSRTAKTARLSKAAAAALEGALEDLDTWSLCSNTLKPQQQQQQQQGCVMLDASMPGNAAWQQLQQALTASEGAALGLLYSRTVLAQPAAAAVSSAAAAGAGAGDSAPLAVQYFTSLQPPSKQQLLRLSKAASIVKKQAARSAAAADAAAGVDGVEETGQAELSSAGVQQVVGLAVMPVLRDASSSAAAAAVAGGTGAAAGAAVHDGRVARTSSTARPSYYIHLQQQDQQQQQQQQGLPPQMLQLLQSLLCAPDQRPCVCCGAKDVLCSLMQLGLQLPAAGWVNVIDPELLGWLSDPQCIQDTKDEACYALEQQLARCQVPAGVTGLGPLQRLHTQLACCLQLTTHLHSQLSRVIAGQAIKLEMQVCTLLAKMQACGVACAPSVLAAHRPILAGRLAAIKGAATQLVGRDFNLSSSSQLAKVLYEDLRLVPPAGGGGRGAAKTHLPTNEATLKQLAQVHQLPALVLEHRCILNVMSKWIDAAWVQQAAQQPGGRVHCTWQQAATATGRLSSCGPNLQAVTKYTIRAQDSSSAPAAAADPQAALLLNINVRDAFVAPPGKLLLSADYSQIELRLLAHFSEDALLRQILSQDTGDVFNMIAAALQKQAPGTRPDTWLAAAAGAQRAGALQVSAEERERAKRVVYGIVYGQTPFGLAQSLADQGISTKAAEGMIDSFLARFPGVRQFMRRSIAAAHASGAVSTLMGRHRPISGLAGDFQKRSEAERKVVNSQIQGSAADLIKLAMCAWEEWAEQPQQQLLQLTQPQQQAGKAQSQQRQQPHSSSSSSSSSSGRPEARLMAQIHDELLFEVSAPDAVLGPDGALQHPGQAFLQVAAAVKSIMEGAAALAVPLRVKLAWGNSWGSLADLQL